MIRIYHAEPIHGKTLGLDKPASHHLLTVLRARVNDEITLFDGSGIEFYGNITSVEKKLAQITLHDQKTVNRESSLNIHLGQAIAKGERMDFIMQKAVELGVTQITPLTTARCNVKLDADRQTKRMIHWQKVIISACEQCGRTIIPQLNPITSYTDFVSQLNGLGLLLHPENSQPLRELKLQSAMTLLVGPEGGFSDIEVSAATKAGFINTKLGNRVLRTETASLAAIAGLQTLCGE